MDCRNWFLEHLIVWYPLSDAGRSDEKDTREVSIEHSARVRSLVQYRTRVFSLVQFACVAAAFATFVSYLLIPGKVGASISTLLVACLAVSLLGTGLGILLLLFWPITRRYSIAWFYLIVGAIFVLTSLYRLALDTNVT